MSDNEKAISDALNLDNWSEAHGYTDLEGAKCPHCKTLSRPTDATNIPRRTHCSKCGRQFVYQLLQTPLGPAILTRTDFSRKNP